MTIGDKIKKYRKELNLSQAKLAKMTNLKPPSICQYESGKRTPCYDALKALSKVLNIPIETLISDEMIDDDKDECTDLYYLFLKINNLSITSKNELIKYVNYLRYLETNERSD